MHILIIGAAGMVGRNPAERLARDGALGGKAIDAMTLVDVVTPDLPGRFYRQGDAGDRRSFGTSAKRSAHLPVGRTLLKKPRHHQTLDNKM